MEKLIDNAETSVRSNRFNIVKLTAHRSARASTLWVERCARGRGDPPGPDESPNSESSDIAVSNPAPRLPATQVDCDDELLLSQLANELANVPGPEVHVLSEGSSGSGSESLEPVERTASHQVDNAFSEASMFHCIGTFALQMRSFAIWLHGKGKCRGSSDNSVGLR